MTTDARAPQDRLPGRPLPTLSLPSTDGVRVALDRLTGRTVLYLYPLTGRPGRNLPEGWDTIPGARGCTPEACDFRDHHADLRAAGADRVYGVSAQHTDEQREVVDRLRLPFPLLSDPRLTLAARLGLPTFRAGGTTLFGRLTLVLLEGVVEHVFHPVRVPAAHAREVLAWLGSRTSPPDRVRPPHAGEGGRGGAPRSPM
ncbi:peroxiredoxin [Pseudonocardia sp. RS010]|uniref:peroxiredoxin n=1 Tax=Pseudonocardia sp. RS010 TaxID=3385979 RepID=UPI0039A05ECB